MSIWEGVSGVRAGIFPPDTPDQLPSDTLSYVTSQPPAATTAGAEQPSSRSTQQQQQQWQGAWQAPQQQLQRAGSGSGSISAAVASSHRSPLEAAAATAAGASTSQPVRIPHARALPYSRLRAHSASSISPSPSNVVLSSSNQGSPQPEEILALRAHSLSSNGIVIQQQPHSLRTRRNSGSALEAAATAPPAGLVLSSTSIGELQVHAAAHGVVPNKRPPLPPSPQARSVGQLQPFSSSLQSTNFGAAAGAGGSSSTGLGGADSPQYGRLLSSSFGAYGSGRGFAAAWDAQQQQQQQQQQKQQVGCSNRAQQQDQLLLNALLPPGSLPPAGEGLLAPSLTPAAAAAAASVGAAVAAVAGNPHHPHHQQTMQLLLQHQQHQLQQLHAMQQHQQLVERPLHARSMPVQRSCSDAGGSSASLQNYYGGLLASAAATGWSPQSPRVLTKHTSSYNRLSDLGTSPGLVEAAFMGLAARAEPCQASSSSSSRSRSAALEQMTSSGIALDQQLSAAAAAAAAAAAGSATSVLDCAASAARSSCDPTPHAPFTYEGASIDGNATSPVTAAAAGSSSSSPLLPRSFSRRSNSGLGCKRSGSGLGLGSVLRSGGSISGYPTCLICLDQLTPADFESGEAMILHCRCKGEVAMRHRQCAEKWSRIKGSTTCDVCKALILNLPDVPPLPPPPGQIAGEGGLGGADSLWSTDEPPAVADYFFDCIRVTWVVLIVCILFFKLDVARSFVTGALMGTVYVALAASWAAARRRAGRQRLANAATVWATGLAPGAGAAGLAEQRVPLLQGLVGGLEGMPV